VEPQPGNADAPELLNPLDASDANNPTTMRRNSKKHGFLTKSQSPPCGVPGTMPEETAGQAVRE
jgi:hypothetical protein